MRFNTIMKARIRNIIAVMTVVAMAFAMAPAYTFAYTASKANNSKMVSALPTVDVGVAETIQGPLVTQLDRNGIFCGYQIYRCYSAVNAKASTASGMKKKVAELTAGKSSDYAKAKAIHDFVQVHMNYIFGAHACIDDAWERGMGNCETYAEFTSMLLYYAGIPNAYAITYGHIFNLILCDGRWVPSDSQAYFDGTLNVDYPAIETIVLQNGKMQYVVDDLSGLKLAGVGTDFARVDSAVAGSGITIPAYVKGYYRNWMDFYPDIAIRGTKGTSAERFVEESGYSCINYTGNQFSAVRSHAIVRTAVKSTATYFTNGEAIDHCKICGKSMNSIIAKKKLKKSIASYKGGKRKLTIKYTFVKGATGFQVAYKKAGASKYTMKNFNTGKSAKKTVKRLKRGKYTVKARAYIKSGEQYSYTTWTKTRTVRVK